MEDLIIGLLGPIFYGMGVSEADFVSYVGMCINYIYGVLAVLVALIVVLILAMKAKKGTKAFIRLTALVAAGAALLGIANAVCFGPLQSNLSTIMNAPDTTISDESIAQSRETVQKVGEEGMVLLENDGMLPLSGDVTNINVFGWASTNPIYGGTGSGSSGTSGNVGIIESLQDAGYSVNDELVQFYTAYATGRSSDGNGAAAINNQSWNLPEPPVGDYSDELMANARDFSNVAMVVFSRSGGEGADLPTDMNAVIHGTYGAKDIAMSVVPENYTYFNASYDNNGPDDDFDEGEHYLQLSNREEELLDLVCSNFDSVIVVVNANNAMELGWIADYPQIRSAIWAPGPGVTGFTALGEIINGSVNPSGKTADTFVADLTATPTFNNFGNFPYTNVDDLKQQIAAADYTSHGSMAFVNYVEGIYVGYKYYETAAVEGSIDYDAEVVYPFGYGLSYTSFDETIENFNASGDTVTFDVVVTNTGSVAGKHVVEVYFTPPYTNGGIEKAAVNLIQFEKSKLLEPGESQTISFSIPKEDMASYDSTGIKVSGGGYILEAGDYTISVREDSHTVLAEETFTIASDISYANGREGDVTAATNQFEDYSRGEFVQLSRANAFANYAEATAAPNDAAYVMSDDVRASVSAGAAGIYDPTLYDDPSDAMPTQGAEGDLRLFDMVGASYDDERWEQLIDEMSFEDMVTLTNVGGWQTVAIESIGKVATSDCDGPAGLNNLITGAQGTSFPAEVLMAQTWNRELLFEVGQSMCNEFADANNFGWYGPAMNTHRNAFAGRNFEYYSEDGVLAGYLAAAEINGSVEKGVYPYLKHFALNDQETNRQGFLLTFAFEQAIREIYLKPFELAVKGFEGNSIAIMSSYNFIGTIPSTSNAHLLNNVLRDEWGFEGMVETDYDGSYGFIISDKSVRNGNDLQLGFASLPTDAYTDQSATVTIALRQASKNILYTIVNSGCYTGVDSDPSLAPDKMVTTFNGINMGVGAGLVVIEALAVWLLMKGRKKAAAA